MVVRTIYKVTYIYDWTAGRSILGLYETRELAEAAIKKAVEARWGCGDPRVETTELVVEDNI